MKRYLLPQVIFFFFIFLIFLACNTGAPQTVDYAQLSDEEKRMAKNAIAGLEVAEGLEATLFASEPMMLNPTNIDIDA
ncbi:MAG: hypothetical protein KDE26_20440, partial [Bacteroidetes bacterium]|nr:hypothetical protein [Bacteroidota bacterium]